MLALTLIVGGISAQAAGILNSDAGGYLVCVNAKTKVITHPGTSKCPKGIKKLVLSAKGAAGAIGLTGAAGPSGRDGKDGRDGKTLWNGLKDPESTWGAPGDVFINSISKTIFGPKNLDNSWPLGVSMVGPQGAVGPTGLTGAMGPQGPGGSGPAGATGATGAIGATGSNATLTCAQGGTCVLGDTGPGGGKVFIVQNPTEAAPWRYMEAAPKYWKNNIEYADPIIKWCNVAGNLQVPDPVSGEIGSIATSDALGAGYANTQRMLRGCTWGAAHAVAQYNSGGKSDWHLPSKAELNQLYIQKILVGGFVNFSYWSSSEDTEISAWSQDFGTGTQTSGSKGTRLVRPVRSF